MLLNISRIAHPTSFAVLLAGYLALGSLCSFFMDELGYVMSIQFFFYSAVALALYVLGCRYTFSVPQPILLAIFSVLFIIMTYRDVGIVSFIGLTVALVILYNWEMLERYSIYIGGLGILLLIVNLVNSGTIPLINPSSRYDTQTVIFVFGYSLSFLGTAYLYYKNRQQGFILASMTFIILLFYGFRSYILILVLSIGIQSLLQNPPSLRKISMGLVFVSAIIIVMGFIVVTIIPQREPHTLLSLPFYRAGFTAHMLNEACKTAGLTGHFHGELWTFSKTSPIIGTLLAKAGNITTTLIGPPILDGGIFEMPLFFVFGTAMNTLYHYAKKVGTLTPPYSIALSIMFISADISPFPLIVLMFLMGLMLVNRYENKGILLKTPP